MDKGKIKNLILNNKSKSVIVVATLILIILLVSIIAYATSAESYVVEVKDNGESNIAQNSESSITKKIISDSTKSLTYEVALKNLNTRSANPEVAILIDTSSSMSVNDIDTQVKPKAIEFIQGLLSNVSGVRISISNNKAVKASLGTSTIANYTNIINAIVEGEGTNLNDGLDNALSTFSTADNDKYLVIFSDATDSALEKLQTATSSGIDVYSILTDITNNEYIENAATVGNVQMISDIIDFSSIYNKINKSMINVKVTDIFTEETNNYFKFEVGTKDSDLEVTRTDNGYEINCANIKAGQTKKVQFTLTLDENAGIDAGKIYRDLNTSDNMTVEYEDYEGEEKDYKMNVSPTYIICKKYSLTIEAVSEKSDKLPVTNLDVKVVGTVVTGQDEDGNDIVKTVYDSVLTTDSYGKIKIDDLKTLGDITFEIKPVVNQLGYSETDATTIIVHNDPTGVGTIWAESDVTTPEVDVVERNINVKLPISVQTYAIKVETIDSANSSVKLGDIEYRLIQPKLNSKYDMEALYATTDKDGNLTFRPAVMTKDGKYEYILSQLTEQEGYDSMGNVTLYVTFKEGKVTEFTHKYNSNVESQYVSETEEKVIVKNISESVDTFRLEINVMDSKNNDKKLEGAIYNVEYSRVASNGSVITNTINNCITNADGKIELDLPGTGNVRVKITEVQPKTGYNVDTTVREIVFSRTDGRVQYVTAKNPIDVDAIADSDANALVVNLTSVEREAKNRIQVHMVDNLERDINIPNALLGVTKIGDTKTYKAITDVNGIANFDIADEKPGIYVYEIELLSGIPSGYTATSLKLGTISVHFDDDRYIDDCSDTGFTVPYFSPSYQFMVDGTYSYHTALVDMSLTPDEANTYNFQIKLIDDNNKALQGAKYDITIESGDIVRKITARETDASGMLTTRLVGQDNIKVTVKQKETVSGHIINTQEQIIELTKIGDLYQITHQEPYTYDLSNGQKIGAEVSGKNIIYHDLNKEKTGNNTILNLYVNKKDTNGNLVGGVRTILTSPTLKLAGEAITADTSYSATAKSGNVFTLNPAVTDSNGYFEIEGISVNGAELNDGERVDYLYMYEIDNNGDKISNTDITLKLTFRYNENKKIIQVTNVEATWGNRLIAEKTFDGYETNVAYESNVYLDIYTNYDDVGNFSLDLNKINKKGDKLQGAKYDVTVTRLDGSRLIRKDLDITESVEFSGFLVGEGTKIEITEKAAPIGYAVNNYTEILTIDSINLLTGEIGISLESDYVTPRTKISDKQVMLLPDGTYKTNVTLDLIDYELDTFKFGITTKDSTSSQPISGYKFRLSSNLGAQSTTGATDSQGKTSTLIGANYAIDDYVVTYKVENIKAGNYYKKLSSPIEVKVVFDLNGEVKGAATIAANQNTAGYGTIWTIESTNITGGNDINILINVEPQEKLTVNVQTEEIFSKQQLTNVEYEITPSIINATGTTKMQVGYVLADGVQTYTIKQTNDFDNYIHISNKDFKITYDENGDISTVNPPEALSNGISIVSYSGKEITIKIEIEPSVPFVVTNKAYFGGTALSNSNFEITSSKNISKSATTNLDGNAISYIGSFGTDETITYTVKQATRAQGYASIPEFKVEVTYDADRNITSANLLGDVNDNVQFVTVSVKQPSTNTDLGYNGNTKGIVNIEVKNYPEVQFNIKNTDKRDGTTTLYGAVYEVTSTIPTKEEGTMVDSTGVAVAHLDRGAFNTTVEYTIKELNPASRYQTMLSDAVIEVDFDSDGYIINTPRVTKASDITSASIPTQVNVEDKFKVDVEILSNPELAINITKVDGEDGTLLSKVDFEITARIEKENLSNFSEEIQNKIILNSSDLTEEQYLSQVLDRLKINIEDVQTIKQDIGIKNLINDLKEKGNLTAEEEDNIQLGVNNVDKINRIINLGKATKTQINEYVSKVTNRNVIDALISNNTTTEDRVNELLSELKNLVRLDVDNITTNINGNAIAYMDKTLANKTIEYTIRETRKPDGYDWQDEPIILEITYDETGKMIANNPIRVVSGDIDINGFDIDNFTIETTIKNKQSDEIRIHLTVEDTYDSSKKLETAEFDAYLVDSSKGIGYLPDDSYRVQLASGTPAANGVITHGEDTQTLGIYGDGAGSRILRLVQKQTPNSYYLGDTKYSAAYQSISYALLARIEFNDEGSIISASVYNPGGDTNQIGYIADERYIQVSHTRNTINITVKYYPMLQVQMVTKDIATGEALQAKYAISTSQWISENPIEDTIHSGFINPYYPNSGKIYEINYTTDSSLDTINGDISTLYGAAKVNLAPTEADNVKGINVDSRERIFYIYEQQEPRSPIQYQKYRDWHLTRNYNRLIAKIKVTYDEIGKIKTTELISERSTNNIKSGFVQVKADTQDGYTIQVTVKYAPITTITATVVDQVTGKGLSGIRIDPYVNKTELSNNSYEYRTQKYYTTGANGVAGWTYWGASVANGITRYELNTYTIGSGYDGYFDPGNIILDVTYDENGRVASVTPRSTDAYGDVNAIDISWTNNDIKITIPYSRRFNVKLNKVDYYDSNTKLGAVFKVVSSENESITTTANSVKTIGKVYPGKTVKYTLSETTSPNGYVPVSNLEFYVTFNNDGTVRSTSSTSDYYQFVKSSLPDKDVNRVDKTDLEVNIKNKPRFDVSIDLSDKFYPTLKLEGAIFEMTNSKGDTSAGGVETDKNGVLETYIGPIYPGEEVEYVIKQTNTVNGYYPNNETIRFNVKFNESGKIESYTLLNGDGVATIDPDAYVNKRNIHVSITNIPKDIKVGIYKYDKLTNEVMSDVKFNVKTEVVNEGTTNTQVVTNPNGTVVDVVDNFVERTDYRVVNYTISEIEVPNSYRKIQDVVIQVTYNPDGSIYLYDVLSNDSDVGIELATNKNIKNMDGTPVHIKLTITNDNAYDLIIKDEDINYAGLGIEGTKYDVTINGTSVETAATNKNGITSILNRTEVGEITIRIAERNIGEGYRKDNNNDTTITLEKGQTEYSLALTDNTNPTYATVEVDEEHGTVTVTFKNETKLELNLVKDDINTGKLLDGAVFEITEEEIDNYGNTVDGTLNIITTDDNNTTNSEGLLYFDLGVSKQNKTMLYTLTEITAPTGYTQILPIKVKVTFDMYGRITSMQDDSFRAECCLDSETGKSHNMIFVVSNGTVDPQYTVKVISADSQTNTRINGSIFQVEVSDEEGTTYNSTTGTTRSISRKIAGRTVIVEKGVMKITGIKAENDINISLNQVETATGYVYGSNQISGNVKVNAEFIVSAENLEKDLKLTLIDDGGFEVSIDNTNREITIKVKNDPQLTFDITKIDKDTKEKLSGAEFTVTSVIQTSATVTPTTLDEVSKLTDENGHTTLNGGMIYAGKTLIYTLKENKLDGYNQLDDIVLLVQYDTKGNIIYYEILSDPNDVKILENEEAKITETKRVLGESDVPGIIEVDFDTYEIPTGIGTKILQLQVFNTQESANDNKDYQIVIEKHHQLDPAYPYFIPGVTFQIKVKQEYGKAETTWIDITNEDGIITSPYFSGYGNITVEIKELEAAAGFKTDYETKTITFIRNKDTHKLDIISSDVGYSFSEDNSIIYLKPINEISSNTYNMIINKVDKNSNALITNNPANIEVYRVEEYEISTPVEEPDTGDITYDVTTEEIKEEILKKSTDENGRIVLSNLKAPQEEGTYKYIISETKAPDNYIGLSEDAEVEVTFEKNEEDEMIITNAIVTKGNDEVRVAKMSNQLLSLVITNINKDDIVQDGEYVLDVTKVDEDGNTIISDTAVFKLTDMQTNEVTYYETDEQGKLNIPTFTVPAVEGKYTYTLNEIKSPNGYILNRDDIKIELEFLKDSKEKIYLNSVLVDGSNAIYNMPEEGNLPDTRISIQVVNQEGSTGTGNTNDKRYTFVLNKVDLDTKELITENVEFEVSLANGEIVKGKTNDNGQLRVEDVFMPAEPGEYEFVIKEITNPNGYKVDKEMKILKVTFTGYADNMVISNIVLDDTYNKNIEVLEEKCTEDYIEVNVLNEKENPELYVISKLDTEGNDIYDVLKNYDVPGKHYTIDKPFIDTKVAKYGSNVTVQEFIDNLESNGNMVVLDKDGNELGATDRVKTGMTLKATLDEQELTFTIIVKGDVNGDGRVRTTDLDQLINHLKGEKITDPIQLRALDLDLDGRVRTTDLNEFYNVIAKG